MGAVVRASGDRGMTTGHAIARLKVTLEDVEPAVMRRLDVPLRIRLDRLHLVLQAALGWTNSHLYEFTAGGTGWGVPDPDFGDGPLPAPKATLHAVIEETGARTIHYVYDYGDNWNHVIRIERIGEPDPQALYPQLVAATGRCPPEDVGGRQAMLNSSPPSPTRRTKSISRCSLGVAAPSTPRLPMLIASRTSSIASPANGRSGRVSRRPCRRDPEASRVAPLPKQRCKQRLGPPKPLVGKDHRLRLAHRVPDQTLAVEAIERVPVEALPGPAPVMKRQAKQREHRIVDLIGVDLHTSDATTPKPPLSTFFSAALGEGLRSRAGELALCGIAAIWQAFPFMAGNGNVSGS